MNTNKILNRLGSLNTEDSIYTAILPSNTAWSEAYTRIKPYFNTLAIDGGAAQQRAFTQWAIVQDLVFRKIVSNPGSLDSLVSTTRDVFYHPDSLFIGTTPASVSNGLVYISDLLQFKASNSWQKEIRVEAEKASFTDTGMKSNCDIFLRTSAGSGFNISNNSYIYIKNLATSNFSPVFVKFRIPNTLSAKYNIYCVFVPTIITDVTDLRPSKVNFYLTWVDANGVEQKDKSITVATNVTDPTKPTKMFVTQFQFPICNLMTSDNYSTYIASALLKVENAVKTTETVAFNRDMRIDCIILEPVQ